MIRIAVNQSNNLTMVPLKGAQVRTSNGWVPVKATDKIYLNGQWYDVGEETASTGNQLRLVDSLAGIDILFTPVKAGTLDLSGFGLNTATVTDVGIGRMWYGVSNVSSYPMILGASHNLSSSRAAEDWLIMALTPDTLGGSTGTYDLAYYSNFMTTDPWNTDLVNDDSENTVFLTQVDSYVEPLDPSTLFPN